MSIRKYKLSRFAAADLVELWEYVFDQTASEHRANKVIADIVDKFDILADDPHMGRSREEFGFGYRSFPAVSHVIYYRLVSEGIEISRVLHGALDTSTLLLPTPNNEKTS